MASDNLTQHNLNPEAEIRIEVPANVTCTLILQEGSAEIFGAEIPLRTPIELTGKVAVFTWHGCALGISHEDKLDMIYESAETDANVCFVNAHAQLEAMRDAAATSDSAEANHTNNGPRVLLVGPADSGKSALARTLTAYAVKLGRTPLLVDLDASQNMLSVPGTMAVAPASVDVFNAESYTHASMMGGSGASMPFVLWYGSEDCLSNEDLYRAQVKKLASVIEQRLGGDADMRASGIIVNTSGCIEGAGYDYLVHAIDSFRIDVVLVMGHDRLYSMLGTHFAKTASEHKTQDEDPAPKLIKMTRSGGVVARDSAFRRATRAQSIKRYFYGDMVLPKATETAPTPSPQRQFSPSLAEVSFSDVKLYEVSRVSLSASLLPVSSAQATDPIQLEEIEPASVGPNFTKKLLAVCHPTSVESYARSGRARDLYLGGIAGFVVVEKVDQARSSFSMLSPCVGSLPSTHFLTGDISWME